MLKSEAHGSMRMTRLASAKPVDQNFSLDYFRTFRFPPKLLLSLFSLLPGDLPYLFLGRPLLCISLDDIGHRYLLVRI